MKNNLFIAVIIIFGIIILTIFSAVCFVSLSSKGNESNSYYQKTVMSCNAKIENLYIENGNLIVITSDNSKSVCIKTTKSNPNTDSICWKDVTNNKTSMTIYDGKKYYVWVKDNLNNICNYSSINS